MKEQFVVLVIELGASLGRIILGRYREHVIVTEEIHQFASKSVMIEETCKLDAYRLGEEIQKSIEKNKELEKVERIFIWIRNEDINLELVEEKIIGIWREQLKQELERLSCKEVTLAEKEAQYEILAVPSKEQDFIYLCCGNWSVIGTELEDKSRFEKEGYEKQVSLSNKGIGLWLIEESRRHWIREGSEYSLEQLVNMAGDAVPFQTFIDPDDKDFLSAGDLPTRIRQYCRKTGQMIPRTEGEMMRCVLESLAMKYRVSLEDISEWTGKSYDAIHVVGKGAKYRLLCQMIANVCKVFVTAGPSESGTLGMVAYQLLQNGTFSSVDEAREVIANSETIVTYLPEHPEVWEDAYLHFCKVTGVK